MSKTELFKKLRALGKISKEQRNEIVCSLTRHSLIQTTCFGYFYCGRCNSQVGDQLGSIYDAKKVVIVGHNCKACRQNFTALTWIDKLYAPNPFK